MRTTITPWAAELCDLPPAKLRFIGATEQPPVVVHHGFLIEHHYIVERLTRRLRAADKRVVLLDEHFIRTLGSAHALGHDSEIPLAYSLSRGLDQAGVGSFDIIAAGTGAASGLLVALNDERVRRCVLLDPALVSIDHKGSIRSTSLAPKVASYAELALEMKCTHEKITRLDPAAALNTMVAKLDIPVMLVTRRNDNEAARMIAQLASSVADLTSVQPGASSMSDDVAIDVLLQFLD